MDKKHGIYRIKLSIFYVRDEYIIELYYEYTNDISNYRRIILELNTNYISI